MVAKSRNTAQGFSAFLDRNAQRIGPEEKLEPISRVGIW
jgi:hypothetical protein